MIKIQLVNGRLCQRSMLSTSKTAALFITPNNTSFKKLFFSFLKNKNKVVNFFKLTFTTFKTSLYKNICILIVVKKTERKKEGHTHTHTHTHTEENKTKRIVVKNASIMRHIYKIEKWKAWINANSTIPSVNFCVVKPIASDTIVSNNYHCNS